MAMTGLRRIVSNIICCSTKPNPPLAENQYTYTQVKKITNNFDRVVGKGGFGVVYHGILKDQQVAVKTLNRASIYDTEQFTREVHVFLTVRQKNLVSLIGYCDEGEHLALIYEFVENGDLKDHLSGKFGNILSWESRLKISVEVAQGLEYLHGELGIIHKYLKLTNILLDRKFEPKLADFGLSRSSPTSPDTEESCKIYLNPGKSPYLDPEYFRSNWLTKSSDVYSLGIVLLVIITNQPVIDNNRERPHISDWVDFKLQKGDIQEIIDPRLNHDFANDSAWKALEIAGSCACDQSSKRPSMGHVVKELNECLASEMVRTHGRTLEITQETQ